MTLTPRFRMSEMIGLKAFQVRREEERERPCRELWMQLGHMPFGKNVCGLGLLPTLAICPR